MSNSECNHMQELYKRLVKQGISPLNHPISNDRVILCESCGVAFHYRLDMVAYEDVMSALNREKYRKNAYL